MKKLDRPISQNPYNYASTNIRKMLELNVSERLARDLHNRLWVNIISKFILINSQLKQNTEL